MTKKELRKIFLYPNQYGIFECSPYYEDLMRVISATSYCVVQFRKSKGTTAATYVWTNQKTSIITVYSEAAAQDFKLIRVTDLLHEYIHHGTLLRLRDQRYSYETNLLKCMLAHGRDMLGIDSHYGFKNVDEFCSELISCEWFRHALKHVNIPSDYDHKYAKDVNYYIKSNKLENEGFVGVASHIVWKLIES